MLELILVVAVLAGLVVGVGVLFTNKAVDRSRGEALAAAEDTYAALFDGSTTVVYESHDGAIPVDVITKAADERGYQVESVSPSKGIGPNGRTVVFRKVSADQ